MRGGRATLHCPGSHTAATAGDPWTTPARVRPPALIPKTSPSSLLQPSTSNPPLDGQRTACGAEPGQSLPPTSPWSLTAFARALVAVAGYDSAVIVHAPFVSFHVTGIILPSRCQLYPAMMPPDCWTA